MPIRAAAMMTAMGLTIAATMPLGAMPLSRISLGLDVQHVSLHELSPRSLLIRRGVTTLAVGPEWTEGWGVPIVGSVRIRSARLERW